MQEKCVVSEKKFGKSFQYDLPGDLVMAYLADVRYVLLFSVCQLLLMEAHRDHQV